ncbi:hypothetical protein WUBG_01959 [Wuchereria bancrofti]|uniref:Uncharacterized protein n=1 Tax=Wuchereria bancrofti TaxID=6293 RepID=J9BID8_WUCBA|nr:hypothetical protein WUBG_01959 [Wuchereria bancrofti]VDM20418.1 unnamed protein product [Wuchereria bancrofti]
MRIAYCSNCNVQKELKHQKAMLEDGHGSVDNSLKWGQKTVQARTSTLTDIQTCKTDIPDKKGSNPSGEFSLLPSAEMIVSFD